MTRYGCLAIALAAMALNAGCDTEQPLQSGGQNLKIGFRSEAAMSVYNVWDTQVDIDGDGVTDRVLWCEAPVGPPTRPVDYPLNYSVSVELIPGGLPYPRRLSPAAAAEGFPSLTPYDEAVPGPAFPENKTVVAGSTTLQLTGGREITVANRDFIETPKIVAPDLGSICPFAPALDLGESNFAGRPAEFGVLMQRGDTVVVRARMFGNPGDRLQTASPPRLFGVMTLNGRAVTPAGSTSTTTDPGAGVTFSFTYR